VNILARGGIDGCVQAVLDFLVSVQTDNAWVIRPRLMSVDEIIEAHRYIKQDGKSHFETAQRYKVSESTLLRSLKRVGATQY